MTMYDESCENSTVMAETTVVTTIVLMTIITATAVKEFMIMTEITPGCNL
jgi:hypothetical protein